MKPWVSRGVSFGTFLSLMKEKYEHLRKTKKEHHPRGGVLFGAKDGWVLAEEKAAKSAWGSARGRV